MSQSKLITAMAITGQSVSQHVGIKRELIMAETIPPP